MGTKKLLVAGGIVAVVAAGALLVPGLAFGQPIASVPSGPVAVQDADGLGRGQGNAWGHHKHSPDFPGQGKGHDKSSPDFPGQGKGLEKDHGNPHSDD